MPLHAPTYRLAHEVLPYEMERSLPIPVVCNIYSFLRKKQTESAKRIEYLKISINHKLSVRHELLQTRKALREARLKQKEALIAQLEKIIATLEVLVLQQESRDHGSGSGSGSGSC